jgi:hypothetical protein
MPERLFRSSRPASKGIGNVPDDYAARLIAELEAHDVHTYHVDRARPHPQLRFEFNGRKLIYTFPASPSSREGIHNAISQLRRIMGVARIIKKSTSPPKKRNKTQPHEVLTFATKPNPLLKLSVVADRLREEKSAMRQKGMWKYLEGESGTAPNGSPKHLADSFLDGWYKMHARKVRG